MSGVFDSEHPKISDASGDDEATKFPLESSTEGIRDAKSDEESMYKEKKEASEISDIDLPSATYDEFSTSSGDLSSIYSLENREAPYLPKEIGDENTKTSLGYLYMLKLVKYLKIGAMGIIATITRVPLIQHITLSMGLGKVVTDLLTHKENDIVTLALKIIANITQQKFGRSSIRKNNAIPYLILYCDIDRCILISEFKTLTIVDRMKAIKASYCVRAIKNLSKCQKGREALYHAGLSDILYDLINSNEEQIITNALYIFNHCAKNDTYNREFLHYKIHKFMTNLLNNPSPSISTLAAHYLLAVCGDERVLQDIINYGLLNILMEKANSAAADDVPAFYNTAIKILFKISRRESILQALNDKNAVQFFYNLVELPDSDVEAEKQLWELIADFAGYPENWMKIWKLPNMEAKLLYNVQSHLNEDIRGSAARIIGHLVLNKEIFTQLSNREIIVKLWTLLQVKSPYAVESACRALLPVMKRTIESPEVVRGIRRGIFVLMNLLQSDEPDTLAGVILLLSKIIQDKLNLEILTSMGALSKVLSFLTKETYPKIRAALCYLIASLGTHRLLNFQIGRDGYIPIVINDLKSDVLDVKISAAYALWKLSEDPINCVIMHSNGVADILLKYLLIDNDDLQLAAGGCLYNIRNLAFNAEVRKWIFFNEPVDSETEKGIKKYRENVIDEEPKKELEVIEIPVNTVKKFKKEKLLKVRFGDRGDEFSLDDSVTLPEKTEKEE
ncbi:uncharacterized protein isoform X2 [Rhodnius prolixus]|uniref:uncharacterized protein isoform X2 n=1 Tax=Rhodnius prolixus TaxID=13249 RepID=UPI003D1890FB